MNRIILILVLVSLACGVATTLPTQPAPTRALPRVNAAPVPDHVPDSRQMVTIGKLNLRSCPSTACSVSVVLEAETIVQITGKLYIDDTQIDCNRWYPVRWQGVDGYVCAGWLK